MTDVLLDNGQEAPWDHQRGRATFEIAEDGIVCGVRTRRADGTWGRFKRFACPVKIARGDTLYVSVETFGD